MTQQIKISVYLLSLAILLFSSLSANAAEYYIATDGSDANSGTITQPWLTLRKAVQTLVAGDIAYLRGGTYTGANNRNLYNRFEGNSGTAGNPITIKNYSGETPIIDGGFTSASGRVPIFDIDGHHYITLDGLTIRRGSTAGIFLAYDSYATNIVIKNSVFEDFVSSDNSGHIYIDDGADITIENNIFRRYLGTSGNAAGIIIFRAGNLIIRNNEISSTRSGIYYKHSLDNGAITIIENNLIYNQTDMGLKYSKSDSIIRNNIIRDSTTGIQIFEESASCDRLVSDNNQIIHNTIVDL
ncbi:MAG: right-handed parallel beta-helix repeat-containing protein [Nitrospirae bacterium]|nr:right-handed parallel beta-helix repeat-containing protein [Nitrospirota bacterium]